MQCQAIKSGGERCKKLATDSSGLCSAHSPHRAAARSEAARKGGRAGGNGRPGLPDRELQELRQQLQSIADGVLVGVHDPRRGAVAVQALQAKGRILELARKWKEVEEFEDRLREVEETVQRRGPRGRAR